MVERSVTATVPDNIEEFTVETRREGKDAPWIALSSDGVQPPEGILSASAVINSRLYVIGGLRSMLNATTFEQMSATQDDNIHILNIAENRWLDPVPIRETGLGTEYLYAGHSVAMSGPLIYITAVARASRGLRMAVLIVDTGTIAL